MSLFNDTNFINIHLTLVIVPRVVGAAAVVAEDTVVAVDS